MASKSRKLPYLGSLADEPGAVRRMGEWPEAVHSADRLQADGGSGSGSGGGMRRSEMRDVM